MTNNQPIAILDSGVGGLSVFKAIKKIAPRENIFYFGDTANFPYGIKSPQLITKLAINAAKKIVDKSNAKLLIIGCHTISVTCLKELSQELNIKIIGINNPSTDMLANYIKKEKVKEVLILSTKATLSSGFYRKAWQELNINPKINFKECALDPLVNLVEEGCDSFSELFGIADSILPKNIRNSDLILLGCTHFLPLEPIFRKIFKPGCQILDAAMPCAQFAISWLTQNHLLSNNNSQALSQIFVSSDPKRFISAAKLIDEPLEIFLLD